MKKKDPCFLPCVATHFLNVTVTSANRMASDMEKCMDLYNGALAPGLSDRYGDAIEALTALAVFLNGLASRPQDISDLEGFCEERAAARKIESEGTEDEGDQDESVS